MLLRAFQCVPEAGLALDTMRLWRWLQAHRHHSVLRDSGYLPEDIELETRGLPGSAVHAMGGFNAAVAADAHNSEWDRVAVAGIRAYVSAAAASPRCAVLSKR